MKPTGRNSPSPAAGWTVTVFVQCIQDAETKIEGAQGLFGLSGNGRDR